MIGRLGRRHFLLLGAAALVPARELRAAPSAVGLSKELQAELAEVVLREMSRQGIPGLSIAAGRQGKLLWEEGFGLADLESRTPATPRTRFRLASISKPITAVAAVQLWEEGRLDLDAPVQRYVPRFPEKQWPVTTRQLLGHLGGVRHYRNPAEAATTTPYSSVVAALEQFENDPLSHEPGTRYHYSSFGFNLAGAAVEGAAGLPFTEYVRRRIFEPAGVTETLPDIQAQIIPHRAEGYFRAPGGELKNSLLADVTNKIPGGGYIGTSADLVRFAMAFHAGKLVTPAARDLMLTPGLLKDGSPTAYGLGWSVAGDPSARLAGHGGGQPRVSTLLQTHLANGVTVAVMSNLQGAALNPLVARVTALIAASAP